MLRLLEKMASDEEIEVRRAATRAVGGATGVAAADAVAPLLRRIEEDSDPVVRENAARAAGRIGEASDDSTDDIVFTEGVVSAEGVVLMEGVVFTEDVVVRLAGALDDSNGRVSRRASARRS